MDNHHFYSIDRLVEFGMGMALAQQMVRTMNDSMTSMHIPGAMNTMNPPSQKIFYAMIEGAQSGPYNETELARLITNKKVARETYVWMPGLPSWRMAEQIPEVLKIVALTPPPFAL